MADEKKLTIHNKISPNYKSYHIDGAYGGITTRGYISLSFYAERGPIPKSTDFEVIENTGLKKIGDSEDSKKGILREFEVGVYLDINTAKELHTYLENKIKELEKLTTQTQ